MKRIIFYITILAAGIIFSGCNQKEKHTAESGQLESSPNHYTCPMHPDIVRDGPGQCPVCGMDLVIKSRTSQEPTNEIILQANQVKLANIVTQGVTKKLMGKSTAVAGKVMLDESKTETVSSRADGRIEKLYFKETGALVKKGEPLYTLYSEKLLVLEREYLLAKDQYDSIRKGSARHLNFLKAAEKKLRLYGLTESQIDRLSRTRSVDERITFLSPVDGIVTEIKAGEGQYISEGTQLLRIDDLEWLWVEAELYPGEGEGVTRGDKAEVSVVGYENTPRDGEVVFMSPEYRANSQVTIVRISLNNPKLVFLPGMPAEISFTRASHESLAIPTDAVIRDANGAHVYVVAGENTFQPRRVSTGLEDFRQVEITEGLAEGDTVVVSGAYLLYSELILKRGRSAVTKELYSD